MTKLTKDNKMTVREGDILRFANGDTYAVTTVCHGCNRGGYPTACYTLHDLRDGRNIYGYPASQCYGAEIIRADQ